MAVSDSAAVSEVSKDSLAKFADGCYLHNPQASADACYEHVQTRLSQALAMLVLTFGEGQEFFNRIAQEHRDNYLWCVHSLVEEALELVCKITTDKTLLGIIADCRAAVK